MKKLMFMFVAACLLVGCATKEHFEKKMNSWVGQDINELISFNGYPQSQIQAPNGNTVYIYTYQDSFTLPTDTTVTVIGKTTYTNTSGGQTFDFYCQRFFEVDKNNIIVNWQYQGSDCW